MRTSLKLPLAIVTSTCDGGPNQPRPDKSVDVSIRTARKPLKVGLSSPFEPFECGVTIGSVGRFAHLYDRFEEVALSHLIADGLAPIGKLTGLDLLFDPFEVLARK